MFKVNPWFDDLTKANMIRRSCTVVLLSVYG